MSRRLTMPLVVVAYASLWSLSSVVLHGRSDLDYFFWPAAETAARGHLLLIYSSSALQAGPYANGPIGILPLIPVALVLNALGMSHDAPVVTAAAETVFALLLVAMAWLAVAFVRSARGSLEWRLGAFAAFLFAPISWLSVADFGHLEQPVEIALIVIAISLVVNQRFTASGAMCGLALLARSTAVLSAIPLVIVASACRGFKAGGRVGASVIATAGLGLLPFVIADGPDLLHSLAAYRGSEPIGGGSIWALLHGSVGAMAVQRIDIGLVVVAATALSAFVVWRRPTIAASGYGLCGLMAIASACFPMLAKTVYPYYLMEPYVFGTMWWLARPGSAWNRRVLVPLSLTIDAFFLKLTSGRPLDGAVLIVGAASTCMLAIIITAIVRDLMSQPEGSRSLGLGARATK